MARFMCNCTALAIIFMCSKSGQLEAFESVDLLGARLLSDEVQAPASEQRTMDMHPSSMCPFDLNYCDCQSTTWGTNRRGLSLVDSTLLPSYSLYYSLHTHPHTYTLSMDFVSKVASFFSLSPAPSDDDIEFEYPIDQGGGSGGNGQSCVVA